MKLINHQGSIEVKMKNKFKHMKMVTCRILSLIIIPLLLVGVVKADEIQAEPTNKEMVEKSEHFYSEFLYLDEVVTSSLLGYVFTKDEKWKVRYYEHRENLSSFVEHISTNHISSSAVEDVLIYKETLNNIYSYDDNAVYQMEVGNYENVYEIITGEDYYLLKAGFIKSIFEALSHTVSSVEKKDDQPIDFLVEEERRWIRDNQIIVGVEPWAPVLFINEYGNADGVAGKTTNALVERYGLNIRYVTGDWVDLVNKFQAGEIDVIPNAYYLESRRKYGEFSQPYFSVRELFYVVNNSQINSLNDINEQKIAIPAGYATIGRIKKRYPELKIVETKNINHSIELLLSGDVDLIIDSEFIVDDALVKKGIVTVRSINEEPLTPSPLHYWVNKDKPILVSIINKGLKSLNLRDVILSESDWLNRIGNEEGSVNNLKNILLYVVSALVIIFITSASLIYYFSKVNEERLVERFSHNSSRYFLLILLVTISFLLVVSAVVVLNYSEEKTKKNIGYNLNTLLSSTHEQLNGWVKIELDVLEQFSRSPMLIDLTKKLLNEERSVGALLSSPIQGEIRELVSGRKGITGSFGFFIISPDNITLSSSRDSNVGTLNVIHRNRPELLKKTFLGKRTFIPPMRSDVFFNSEEGIEKPPTMFFAVPITDVDGSVIAVLTKRIDFNGEFSRILASGFIGHSGETYAIDENGVLLSKVRFSDELREIGLIGESESSALNIHVRDPGVDLTKNEKIEGRISPLTLMAEQVVSRQSGYDLKGYRDYRGIPVVGAWIWDQELGMGITAEMDVSEAYELYYIFNQTLWVSVVLSIFLMTSVAIFMFRVGVRVAHVLQRSRNELEKEVIKRTYELQRSVSLTKAVVDNTSDGIVVVDEQGIILEFSPGAERVFGYERVELLESIVDRIIDEPFYKSDYSKLNKLNKTFELHGFNRVKGGIEIEAALNEVEIENKKAYILVTRDISLRKSAEQELRNAKLKAEEATQAKSNFLANMSHEIRTPMNAIIGLSYLALQTKLNKKQHDYILKVHSSAESLLGIINDILDFSKIEAGKLDLENIDFNLDVSIDKLTEIVKIAASEKGIELLVDIESNVPVDLVGDPLRLGQILLNLTNNALKFTTDGEIIIRIKLIQFIDSVVKLQISVSDTGIGMTEEQLNKLFKSFSQADASTTRKYGGTGLGLTICKSLVELMGGEIWVESIYGEGSTFLFTLELGISEKAIRSHCKLDESIQGLSVLVVDDSKASRDILSSMCESLSLHVVTLSNGDAVMDELLRHEEEGNPYQLVLSDWKMPGMNGVDLSEKIINDNVLLNKPKIIIVTAYDKDDLKHEIEHRNLPIDSIITKPVNARILGETLLKLFDENYSRNIDATLNGLEQDKSIVMSDGHILLVEDNDINQQVAQELLSMAGFKVTIANNGLESVNILKESTFDIVLMDVQMPVMDGYEATKTIRNELKLLDIPIIAMTANAMASDKERCLECGMNDHVSKPINPDELFATLSKWTALGNEVSISVNHDDMNSSEFDIEGFDTKSALARFGGNVSSYIKVLNKVMESESDISQRLTIALNEGDLNRALIDAHSFKGIVGSIGANFIVDTAAEIESQFKQSIENSVDIDKVVMENEINKLDDLVTTMINAISDFLQNYNSTSQSETELSKHELINELENIKEKLDNYDSSAIDELEKISNNKLLEGSKNQIKSIEKALEDFDCESAIPFVESIIESLSSSKAAEDLEEFNIHEFLDLLDSKMEMYDSSAIDDLDEIIDSHSVKSLNTELIQLRDLLSCYDFESGSELIKTLRINLSKEG